MQIKTTMRYQFTFTSMVVGLPWWLSSKESACGVQAAGDTGLIPESGRSSGGDMATLFSILA